MPGIDVFGNLNTGIISNTLNQSEFNTVGNGVNAQTLQVVAHAITGGINHSNGPKTNYSSLLSTFDGKTSAQTNAYSFSNFHFANGDTTGLDGVAQSWGRNNAAGDEGTEAITVAALQGDRVTSGTVSSIVGNKINYTNVLNENVRGEDRPLIITTPSKIYSSGMIVSTSGTPTVVTGDGNQDWTTLGPNLFICIDSQTNGVLKLVVPIRSITDANHLVLDYISEGNDAPLPVPTLPSTYKIFRGSNVVCMSTTLGSMNVVDATQFSVGDTFEQPLGYAHTITGIHVHVGQKLPFASNAGGTGMAIGNDANGVTFPIGYLFTGPVSTAFYADTVKTDGLAIKNNPAGALVKSLVNTGSTNLLGVFTGAGQNTFLSYDRSMDVWKTTRPFVLPSFTVANLPNPPCTGSRVYVLDALSPSFLSPIVGGGTTKCPAFYNGTAWVAA